MSSLGHPEDSSNFFSKLFVTWLTPLIKLSTNRNIVETDIWNSPTCHNVKFNTSKLWNAWLEEKQSAEKSNREPSLPRAIGCNNI